MESNVINVSSEVKVTVNLILNASFSWLERPTKSTLSSHLATCIALGLLALSAITFNVCIVLAIFCSSSLKKIFLNQLVSYMSIACLIDCSVNVPFAIYYMKMNTWKLDSTMCALNASCVVVIILAISWILCYMCIERYSSLYKLTDNWRCSLFCRQSVAVATIFILFGSILFPIVAGLVEIRAFPSRYSCVAMNNKFYYRVIVIICFGLPLFVSIICLILAYIKNFRGIRDINCQRIEMSYTELFFEESHLWNEWQVSKFVGTIMILYLILEIPSIVLLMKPSSVPLKHIQLGEIKLQNATVQVSYPIAQITPSSEKIYIWLKFVFCLMFPLVTLLLRKDIRRKVSIIVAFCRTSSSIPNNNLVESPVPQDECLDDFLVPQVWRRRRLSSVTNLKSPIIFGKSRNGSIQFMDLSTGIARWKANYEEAKHNNQTDKPFFADVFEDDEEITEFVCFQDLTEEELNSSEITAGPSTSKNAGVQTTQKNLVQPTGVETCFNISDFEVEYRCIYSRKSGQDKSRQSHRQLSQSFNCHHPNNNSVKYKYYMTFPKMSQNTRPLIQKPENSTTSELLKALEIKRSNKSGINACDLIPRGTEELLDSPVECKDIVSL